jgi:predicted DNA-binding transcriptional regulator YafY
MGLNQMERIHKIDQLLSGGRCMSRQALLAEIAVSAATFQRDLEFMKDRLNAPLIWDPVMRGYRFAESSQAGPRYTLPGMWFNESELYALLTMQHLLDKVEPGCWPPISGRCIRRSRQFSPSARRSRKKSRGACAFFSMDAAGWI